MFTVISLKKGRRVTRELVLPVDEVFCGVTFGSHPRNFGKSTIHDLSPPFGGVVDVTPVNRTVSRSLSPASVADSVRSGVGETEPATETVPIRRDSIISIDSEDELNDALARAAPPLPEGEPESIPPPPDSPYPVEEPSVLVEEPAGCEPAG